MHPSLQKVVNLASLPHFLTSYSTVKKNWRITIGLVIFIVMNAITICFNPLSLLFIDNFIKYFYFFNYNHYDIKGYDNQLNCLLYTYPPPSPFPHASTSVRLNFLFPSFMTINFLDKQTILIWSVLCLYIGTG